MSEVIAVIPARLESTRLPRKMLLAETGKPLIRHTVETVERIVPDTCVATDSGEIAALFDPRMVVKTGPHPCGTDRVADAVRYFEADPDNLILIVQGDEPDISPTTIRRLIQTAQRHEHVQMATLVVRRPLTDAEIENPAIVKVLLDQHCEPIDFRRTGVSREDDPWRHVGVYAWRWRELQDFARLPQSERELSRSLEQMRAIDNGMSIAVGFIDDHAGGIDVRADYDAFVARWKAAHP